MYKTKNRGHLKNEIKKGMYMVKCNFKYTDDYAWDDANNLGKTDYMPAVYFPEYKEWVKLNKLEDEYLRVMEKDYDDYERREFYKRFEKERDEVTKGKIMFNDYDLKSSSGHATIKEDGTISLSIHSNLNYSLKLIN